MKRSMLGVLRANQNILRRSIPNFVRPQLCRQLPMGNLAWNRPFSITTSRCNETSPHKPLSRVPIGGKEDAKNGKFKESTVEFSAGKAIVLFFLVGGALYFFFEKEKRKMETQKEAEANRGYGKPLIGGEFVLYDADGNEFTEKNLLGKFSIIYFGFSHCPDICPDELDKLGIWLDKLEAKNIKIQPIFITCDPARDSPEVLKEYLSDFHDGIIGLSGSYDQVKHCCKKYRVYFSTPPSVKPGQDYLVDHSIFFYLMDPEGQFVEALGQNYDEEVGAQKIEDHVKSYIPLEEREKLNNPSSWYSFLFK